MSGERVYSVSEGAAEPLATVSLAEAGLRERQDLQEWVIARPEILGPDILIVAFEFDRWQNAQGERQRDRLDVLGIDTDGRLVLAELKRDQAPDTVEMQAIKYAAMASRFTEDDLVGYHARYLTQRAGQPVTEAAARAALNDHAGELDPDQLRQPRIVLVAGSFTAATSASVVWLSEMGLDISMQRVQAYRIGAEGVIVTVSQLFPIPDVEEFTISPQRAEAVKAKESRSRRRPTVHLIVKDGLLEDGAELTVRPINDVTSEIRERVTAWVAEDPTRGQAKWSNNTLRPLIWAVDGEGYKPTSLVKRIISEATGRNIDAVEGPRWWVLTDGTDLVDLALAGSSDASFDWSRLHAVLAAIPVGRWTTYGDLADLIGTAAQPLGQHFRSCRDCVNAFRVLDSTGGTRPGFQWSDPADTRTQRDALKAEGIQFVGDRAAASSRLSQEELGALAQSSVEGAL